MTEAQTQTTEPTPPSSLEGDIELNDYIHIIDGKPHIRAGDWDKTKWHTSGYLLQSRLLQLLRHNALGIKGQIGTGTSRDMRDYQVDPERMRTFCNTNTKKLTEWKPKTNAAARERRLASERAERERRTQGATGGKGGQTGTSPAEAKQPTARRRQMTEAQVHEIRRQTAAASSPEQQDVVFAQLAKRYGFTPKAVKEAGTGRTYRNLPMPETKETQGTGTQGAQPKRSGRKTKTAQAVESA
jgi:hypothetical protein